MAKPFAWSYSRLTAYETCPHRFNETAILKNFGEPQTEATMWGNRVHKALELRVANGQRLPAEMQQYEPTALAILDAKAKGAKVEAETKYAITSALTPAGGFFAHNVWCRSIADVTIERGRRLAILDHKTGKPTPNSAQLRLSAAVVMAHKPYIEECTTSFLWLGHRDPPTTEYLTRADIPAIWQEMMPRVTRMQDAVLNSKYPKNPSGLCKNYCPVVSCEHNGKYTGGRV